MTTVLNPTITEAGLQATFNAQSTGTQLELTHIAFGTGAYDPVGNELGLQAEIKRVPIAGGSRISPSQIRVSAIWEDANAESAVSEIGFYAGDVLFAILSRSTGGPYVYKTKDGGLVFSYDWKLSAVPEGSVTVVVDANQSAMLAMLSNHESNPDAHVQYVKHTELAGQLETLKTGLGRVSLVGPKLVYPESTNTYTITDYDVFSAYTVEADKGTVSRLAEVITLVIAADEPSGPLNLKVKRGTNATTVAIAVGDESVGQPTLLSPSAGATSVVRDPVLTSSAYVVYPDGADTHASTDWQMATDADFTNIVWQSIGDAVNLTSAQVPSGVLFISTVYYVRVRHNGVRLGGSEWSPVSSFTTSAQYIARPSITSPADGAINVSKSASLQGSAFATYPSGVDTHLSTRWQLSVAADFSSVFYDSGASTTKLTSIGLGEIGVSLQDNATYYVRIKHSGNALGESVWSPVVSFVTAPQLQGTYTQLPSGPSISSFAMLAEVNGVIYLTGGLSKTETWKFTPSLNQWAQLANAPAATYTSKAVAVIGNDIYVVGAAGAYIAPTLRKYNTLTNIWTSLGNSPGALSYQSLQAINGKLYLFGGRDSWSTSTGTRSLHEYNPATSAWTTKTSPPNGTERYDAASAVLDGKLYIAGGIWDGTSGSTAKQDVWSYDPETDKWTQRASMPWKKYLAAGAAVNGRFYVDGGMNADGTYGGSLLMYDPIANTWTEIPNNRRTENRRDHAAVGLGSNMYVYTGQFFRVD